MNNNIKINFYLLVFFAIVSILSPHIIIPLFALYLFCAVIALFIKFIAVIEAEKTALPTPFTIPFTKEPFVSVIVACCNEPAEIIIKTLEALSQMYYKNFEVIVIDNNNTNQSNWQEIKRYCEIVGKKIKFIHVDAIDGFKAGALNYASGLLDSKSQILAFVDADYIVSPDFLAKTIGYFQNPDIALVQIPQDYFNINKNNIGLVLEYRSFFAIYMNQAQQNKAVTFTGTMGLVRRDVFKKGLKWNEWCITEDTEAGLYMNNLGYHNIYIDRSYGKGMMPLTYNSLIGQRSRWTYGNMQIFKKDFLSIITNKKFSLKQKLSFFSQLLAWFHFELIIGLVFFASSINALIFGNPASITISSLSALVLFLSLITDFVYFTVGLKREAKFSDRIKGMLSHYGLLFSMSYAWVYCLLGGFLGFHVTQKKGGQNSWLSRYMLNEFLIPLLFSAGLLIDIWIGYTNAYIIFVILLFVLFEVCGILFLNNQFIKKN